MKLQQSLLRVVVVPICLGVAITHVFAAPRESTSPPAQQLFLRVNWGNDQGGTAAGDWTPIIGYNHEIKSPRDSASGLPTGKRQHAPLSVSKPIDGLTPLFLQALVDGRRLPAVELLLVQSDRNGNVMPYFTVRLDNVQIADAATSAQTTAGSVHTEEVAMVYEHIEWTYEDGGISASDSWTQL